MSAVHDKVHFYRYRLCRELGSIGVGVKTVLWIMLNPSTADEWNNDPTIRRCINFSKSWGFSQLTVGNLYALRATEPKNLRSPPYGIDVVGPENDKHLSEMASDAAMILLAWGQRGPFKDRWNEVTDNLWTHNKKFHVLGYTKAGEPRHPLMMPKDTKPIQWSKV